MPRQLLTDFEIADKVVDLVAWARDRFGIPEGTQAITACEALRLGLQRAKLPRGIAGLYNEEQALIVISTDIAHGTRFEFTVYHEVMHDLLLEHGELIDYFSETLHKSDRDFHAAIERCCEMGAAEFLLPRHRVREAITRHSCSVDLIDGLANEHGVSLQASAIQIATYAPVDCYVAICAHGVSPLYPHPLTLHIERAARRPGMKYPWARGTPIPDDHIFARAYATGDRIVGVSPVTFSRGTILPSKHGEAKTVGNRVVGILFVGNPPRKGQLPLGL